MNPYLKKKGESVMGRRAILIHGGAGSWETWKRFRHAEAGCRMAARRGMKVLGGGGSALAAVVEAAAFMEEDGRFNAGLGAVCRMDGRTVEMDAACMDSTGRIGAVAATTHPRNPIRLARAIMDTPHLMLAGEGANRFASRLGLPLHPGVSSAARARFETSRLRMSRPSGLPPAWQGVDLRALWNFPSPFDEVLPDFGGSGCDTIGVCALDGEGCLAVANSTGGASPMLLGRVGDSPLPGAGYWAGPAAAVAATGRGEEIARRLLCRTVHDWIAGGLEGQEACQRGVALYEGRVNVGLVALTSGGWARAQSHQMPVAYLEA